MEQKERIIADLWFTVGRGYCIIDHSAGGDVRPAAGDVVGRRGRQDGRGTVDALLGVIGDWFSWNSDF